MTKLTITEALAEIKTIGKRIEKKREFVGSNLARQDGVRDPMEKQGGSPKLIAEERQAIADLEERLIRLRRGIQQANMDEAISISGQHRTIADWLTWRRDVAPGQRAWLSKMRQTLDAIRSKAKSQGSAVVMATATTADTAPQDFVVNIDELKLAQEIEAIEETLGALDGQLSLKNATTFIDS